MNRVPTHKMRYQDLRKCSKCLLRLTHIFLSMLGVQIQCRRGESMFSCSVKTKEGTSSEIQLQSFPCQHPLDMVRNSKVIIHFNGIKLSSLNWTPLSPLLCVVFGLSKWLKMSDPITFIVSHLSVSQWSNLIFLRPTKSSFRGGVIIMVKKTPEFKST